ncbi:hypothetical protein C9374_003602 [Naegleria lovaniensis]|uniref:Uncharacterized protein n=1 Tax=Naegleria lovaniensis TaxID=51637 RepID=A0AA88H3H1_NAELO|nr:uncharacterized protein C9374_003602 [Naegleria lovaniensis]KAG2393838.1 hypothetical protein C9374_003602 [Naegleria lovaniensis]
MVHKKLDPVVVDDDEEEPIRHTQHNDYSDSQDDNHHHLLTEQERVTNDLDIIFGSSSSEHTTTNGHHKYKSKKIRKSGSYLSASKLPRSHSKNYIIPSGFGKFSFKFRLMVVFVIFSVLFGVYFLSGSWRHPSSLSSSTQKMDSSESVFVGKIGNTFGRHLKLILEQYQSGGGVIGDDHDSNLILSKMDESVVKLLHDPSLNQAPNFYSRVRQIHHYGVAKSQHDDISKTSLVLENVCMNHYGEILFYVPSQEFYDKFYKPLLGLSSNNPFAFVQTARFGKRGAIRMKFIIGHKTPKSSPKNYVRWLDRPTIAMMRFSANHLGHLFADNLIALIELATKFNIPLHESLILFLDEVFYRTNKNQEDHSCSSDPSRQVHLPTVNPMTKKHLWCEEELASQYGKKPQAVKNSLVWTQILSSLPVLQKCSYDVKNTADQHTSEEDLQSSTKTTEGDASSSSLFYRIEKAPCPMDDIFSKTRESSSATKRNTILSIQEIEKERNLKLENIRDGIDTCFRQLVLGVGDRTILSQQHHKKQSQFSELPIQQLRNTILSNLGIHSKTSNVNSVNILIDYQSIGNAHEIATILETHLKEDALLLNHLKNINIYKDMKLEQLNEMALVELFSQTHLFLSNATSTYSYLSLFMPTSSYLLLSPECDSMVESSKNPQPNMCSLARSPSLHFLNAMSHLTLINLSDTVEKIQQQSNTIHVELNAEKVSQIVLMILKLRII